MSDLGRLVEPRSVAIVGLSADPSKHGTRVLGHLRRLGYRGEVWGVNPRLPRLEGVELYRSLADLPHEPDLVVAAVPAPAAVDVVAESAGAGGVVVFAAGFAESGGEGVTLQERLAAAASASRTRVLEPNSGGIIPPARRVAAGFLTCLDRPAAEIRSGPVAVVTQSGGTGSYLHNLAVARGEGLGVSIATGNEADIRMGEALAAVTLLDEVRVVVAIIETLRDGFTFVEAVRDAHERAKWVVACRIGTGTRGSSLMSSHTGAMAMPPRLLHDVLDAVGVVSVDTPGEAYEWRVPWPGFPRRRVNVPASSPIREEPPSSWPTWPNARASSFPTSDTPFESRSSRSSITAPPPTRSTWGGSSADRRVSPRRWADWLRPGNSTPSWRCRPPIRPRTPMNGWRASSPFGRRCRWSTCGWPVTRPPPGWPSCAVTGRR